MKNKKNRPITPFRLFGLLPRYFPAQAKVCDSGFHGVFVLQASARELRDGSLWKANLKRNGLSF
jgi:hypothetical protein